jgi:hypothetical protein
VKDYREFVWREALAYLSERADMAAVRRHMALSERARPCSFGEVYQRFLVSLCNRQGMPNSIGPIDRLSGVLFDFDVDRVVVEYDNNWERLFERVRTDVRPTSRMNEGRGYWRVYCKGALSGADYLRQFESLDDFMSFVKDFDSKPTTRPALPFLLAEEIDGIGFALACDFLKEIGFANYSKPDVHLLDIFSRLGIAHQLQLAVFRAVSLMASEVGETPYAVDKAFWLIGSGWLHEDEVRAVRFKTSKEEFVKRVGARWKEAHPDAEEFVALR